MKTEIKALRNDYVLYLTNKQKEAVDTFLKEIASGNYNIRRYRYYYFLHLLNVNGSFGKKDRIYISTTLLHKVYPDWTFIKEMKQNLISWGLVKVVTNQFFNQITNEGKCSSYAITDDYKGPCDCILTVNYYDKYCRFVKKLISKKHKEICDYNELELNIHYNLQKLTIVAPQPVIESNIMLHRISHGIYNIKTWSTGRIGYEFTGVPRIYRKYMRLEGKELIEIDIANCQILLATILFKRFFAGKQVPQDLNNLINVCESGMFYERVMDFMEIPVDNRENFKKKFFELFFAPNYSNESKLSKAFKALYPEVAKALFEIKNTFYKNFSREIQRIESTIIFNVYQKLCDQNVAALIIHDSIVISSIEDIELVKSLIKQELEFNYGLNPKLKVVYYLDGNMDLSISA